MSIVTLKRKTQNGNPRIAPISGNNNNNFSTTKILNPITNKLERVEYNNGFNINGTLRLGPSVGENLGSSFLDTNLGINLKNSCRKIKCTNDPNVIKTSVKNTRGLLSSRGNRCQGNCPKIWNQPISSGSNLLNTQSQHITQVRTRCFAANKDGKNNIINRTTNAICKEQENNNKNCIQSGNCLREAKFNIKKGSKNLPGRARNLPVDNTAKPPPVSISSGEYLRTEFFVTKCIPPPSNSARQLQSWPPNVNNSFCAVPTLIPPYEIN